MRPDVARAALVLLATKRLRTKPGEPRSTAVRRGDRIPQHRLLSRSEWNYLLNDGRIARFTYWTTYGPYHEDDHVTYPHAESVTILREDYRVD